MRSIHTLLITGCLLLALLAAGCTSSAGAPEDADRTLVEYHLSGGFMGANDTVVVYTNNTAIVSRHGEEILVPLNQQTMDNITAIITSEAYQRLGPEYRPACQGYDLFSYEVTAAGKTIHAEDGAVPPALAELIDELNGIAAGTF
ncbi:hypothetical protein E2N92_02300 [Methanofollis formosanus]|uniref:Uncharacterized protein n=1 Tax=Methanofollis formosanus TaxID=299308 RepID=A0A8G1EET2_9EURY|nr:hypothetical protein [Methanofollis formosanus]QYZ78343.1 hypothetical protein E2N92_02300 [Methanofollis formosanus]